MQLISVKARQLAEVVDEIAARFGPVNETGTSGIEDHQVKKWLHRADARMLIPADLRRRIRAALCEA